MVGYVGPPALMFGDAGTVYSFFEKTTCWNKWFPKQNPEFNAERENKSQEWRRNGSSFPLGKQLSIITVHNEEMSSPSQYPESIHLFKTQPLHTISALDLLLQFGDWERRLLNPCLSTPLNLLGTYLERKMLTINLTTVFTEHPLTVPKRAMCIILFSSHSISGQ